MTTLEIAAGERLVGLLPGLSRKRGRQLDQRGRQPPVDPLGALGRPLARDVEEERPVDAAGGRDGGETEEIGEQAMLRRAVVEHVVISDLAMAIAEGAVGELE